MPECNPTIRTLGAIAELSDDIGEVLPYLNATIKGCIYHHEAGILRFIRKGRAVTLHPRRITAAGFESVEEAREVFDQLLDLINNTYERRGEIEPSYKRGDELRFLDIYKLLPGSNCRRCGLPTCLAFATKLAKQEAKVDVCAPLYLDEHRERRERVLHLLESAGYM